MSESSVLIHPTAIISDGAEIGEGTVIGPYSIIGPHVVLGKNNKIAPHVVIEGFTSLGDDNEVFQFASVGSRPQDLKYHGEASRVEIGNKNQIREYVTIQPGTEKGGMLTKVGDGNLFMVSSHLGHDGKVGNDNVIANSVALAGHVTIANKVIIGGIAGVHQFCSLGDYVLVGGGSLVTQDVPPACIVQGDRAKVIGINVIGLERAGYNQSDITIMKKVFRGFFFAKGNRTAKVAELRTQYEGTALARDFMDFIDKSERGVCPIRRS